MKALKGGWIRIPVLEDSTETTLLTSTFIKEGSELVICDKSLVLKRGNVGDVSSQGTPWELTNVKRVGHLYVGDKESTAEEAFLSTDGTELYVLGPQSDSVHQYHLRVPWDVVSGVYYASLDVSSLSSDLTGLYFSPDGSKMFITTADTDKVYRFDLFVPWDITSAVHNSEFSVSDKENIPTGVYFKENGTIMFVVGWYNGYVLRYNLSTPWNITTANYVSQFYVKDRDSTVDGLFFSKDGLRLYTVGRQNNKVYQYNLSTAWDITTASFVRDFHINTDGQLYGVYLSPDGTRMYVSASSSYVYQFSLYYYQIDISEFALDDVPICAFKKERSSVYVTNVYEQEVDDNDWCEYQVSVVEKPEVLTILDGTTYDVLKTDKIVAPDDTIVLFNGSEVISKVVGSVHVGFEKVKTLELLEILYENTYSEYNNMAATFSPDGSTLFVTNNNGENFDKFTLSSPWDLSTATHVARTSLNTSYGWIHDMIMHPSQPYLYILWDSSPDKIVQYTIDENLNINEVSSHELSSSYSITGGMVISPDGNYLVMCVDGYNDTDGALVLWRFNNPWDISSIYDTKVKDISSVLKDPYAISASSDGRKLFVSGYDSNFRIFVFSLSTPWDVSTATLEYELNVSEIVFPCSSYGSGIEYLKFGDAGKKFYIGQRNCAAITQVNLLTAYDVSRYWMVDISAFALNNSPIKAWKKPVTAYVAMESNPDRCLYENEDISDKIQNAATSYFEFKDNRKDLVMNGDELIVNGEVTTVSNVNIINNEDGTYQYQITVPEQSETIATVIIPARTTVQTLLERQLDTNDDTFFISKYDTVLKTGRALRIKIEGDTDTDVTQVQVNLWKDE